LLAEREVSLNNDVINRVQYIRLKHPRMGVRKLQHKLGLEHSCYIGRDRLFRVLREARLLVKVRRSYHKTTQSHHRFYCHPNLIKEGEHQIKVSGPEQLWVADITYVPTQNGDTYLSLITDAWSRKIVGYHVDDTLRTDAVIKAYKNALKERTRTAQLLVHHSDRGLQYCSKQYQKLHEKYGVQCSMTDGYDCYQNALAERVNGIIKNEYLIIKPKNLHEARLMISESVESYNKSRPHMALKYKTPDEVHRAF